MKAELLDYRFGWRWLLPYEPGQTFSLVGFDENERLFLLNDLAAGDWAMQPKQAIGSIIDADHISPGLSNRYQSTISDVTQWVVIVGTGKSVRLWQQHLIETFPCIREYGLLPASSPRVVVPLTDPCHAVIALGLHHPGRWLARFGVRVASLLARLRLLFLLRRRVLLIATRHQDWPVGAWQIGLPEKLERVASDYALYLGTPDKNRKTVVLPLGNFAPTLLIKLGSSLRARQALHNEATSLTTLHKSPIKDQVPQLKGVVDNEQGTALYLEYRPRGMASRHKLEQAVVDFLADLSQLDLHTRPLQELLNDLPGEGASKETNPSAVVIWHWLQRQAEDGAMIWECRGHGDFAPWNCSWTTQGLFVFDWEESRPQALACGDAFYYAIAPLLHTVSSFDPVRAHKQALALAAKVTAHSQLTGVNIKLHFALWTCSKINTHPGYTAIMKLLAQGLA